MQRCEIFVCMWLFCSIVKQSRGCIEESVNEHLLSCCDFSIKEFQLFNNKFYSDLDNIQQRCYLKTHFHITFFLDYIRCHVFLSVFYVPCHRPVQIQFYAENRRCIELVKSYFIFKPYSSDCKKKCTHKNFMKAF